MERRVKGNILTGFVRDFIRAIDGEKIRYIIVSGFVAIAHGRSRGTEDVDLIIERIPQGKFVSLHKRLEGAGFECLQGKKAEKLFRDYLMGSLALRYVRKGSFVPEMEMKLAKDALDEEQLKNRRKLPLTGMPFYFSTIETNIAFKEFLLKSDKDIEDARHLRALYSGKISESKIERIKSLIKKHRLGGK